MKFCLLLLFVINLIASCFAQDYEHRRRLIPQLINQKALIDQYIAVVLKSREDNRALSGYELNEINVSTANRLRLRKEALDYIDSDRALIKSKKKRAVLTESEIKELIKTLSVAVTLFDTTMYAYVTLKQNKKIRQILNESDPSFDRNGNTYKSSLTSLFSLKNRKHLRKAMGVYLNYMRTSPDFVKDEEVRLSHEVIQQSYYYSRYQDPNLAGDVVSLIKLFTSQLSISLNAQKDLITFMGQSLMYSGSKLFGNFAGGFQKRNGLLKDDTDFLEAAMKEMQPLDVLLEKTPFRLTDKFIPGYWGHTAIFIGSEDFLKELGIWNHPLVEKHKKELQKNQFIVEALRSKVEINSLERFSNIDDFAILRLRVPMTREEQKEHILRALSHVGKRYDFNFDVETGKTIVCSELHYRTYINVDFKTTVMLKRNTISVDQVAEQAMTGMPFEPVMVYLNGVKVTDKIQEVYDHFLK